LDTANAAAAGRPELAAARQDFYRRLDARGVAPLWEVLARIVPQQPAPEAVPVAFRYDELRPLLLEAGTLLTAGEVERRVLVLENPALRGQSRLTQSLYAGLQLILPGEDAAPHRHAAAAVRFVLEGEGAFTAVEGERATMQPGDFILTPSWTRHGHGNPGSQPVVWLDGLDIPIVNLFGASFLERFEDDAVHEDAVAEGDALARYGANMLPVDYEVPPRSAGQSSPLRRYPYERTRETLHQMERNGLFHACHGVKMRYINPATGGYPMPTIGAFMQRLPPGFRGAAYRATVATIFAAVEGHGVSSIDGQAFSWGPRDVFVAPSWAVVAHQSDAGAVIFSLSDRPAQQALGLWREQAVD
jgi:gentisate 1,2-dioxygenase